MRNKLSLATTVKKITWLHLLSIYLLSWSANISAATDPAIGLRLDSLKKIIAGSPNDIAVAGAYMSICEIYEDLDSDTTLYWARRFASFAEKKQDWKSLVLAYLEMGTVYRYDLKMQECKTYYDKALKCALDHKQTEGLALTYTKICLYHIDAGSVDDSIQLYFNKAIALRKFVKNPVPIGNAYYDYSARLIQKGMYHVAMDNIMNAIRIYESVKAEKDIMFAQNALGAIHHYMRNYDRSMEIYRQLLPALQNHKAYNLYAAVLQNMAAIYQVRKQLDSSEFFYRKALEANQRYNNIKDNVTVNYNMSKMKFEKQEIDSAIYYAELSLKMQGGVHEYGHPAILGLAKSYLAKHRYREAKEYAEAFLNYHQKKKTWNSVMNAYALLADLNEKTANYPLAYKYEQLYAQLKDSIYNDESSKKIADMEAWYWSAQKKNELALSKKNEELRTNEVLQARMEKNLYASQRNAMLAGIVLLIIFGILLYRIHLQRKKNKMMRQVTELELKAIRAQMNPHFMFNALSAIQLLINKSDIRKANIALTKFGRLMRRILENSEKQMVSIEDEIMTLELYIELESLRFPFSYNLEIDPTLDMENMYIPSLIIQPYVENAIKHGIATKDVTGNLVVKFEKKNDSIFCMVEDDGIGREQSEAGKSDFLQQHKSMATRLTRERLELLNKQVSGKAEVVIKDLTDLQGQPIGTRVELFIPIQYSAN